MSPTIAAVLNTVRSIPYGRCASYGAVGQTLRPPISGLFVGRILARAPNDAPWWRVVAKDGSILIGRRDIALESDQIQRLLAEGFVLEGGKVRLDFMVENL